MRWLQTCLKRLTSYFLQEMFNYSANCFRLFSF